MNVTAEPPVPLSKWNVVSTDAPFSPTVQSPISAEAFGCDGGTQYGSSDESFGGRVPVKC